MPVKEMCWLAPLGSSNAAKILHIRLSTRDGWKPYTAFPSLAVADYEIKGGSKGWATYQKLLKSDFVLVASKG